MPGRGSSRGRARRRQRRQQQPPAVASEPQAPVMPENEVPGNCNTDSGTSYQSAQADSPVLINLRKSFYNPNGLLNYICQICGREKDCEKSFIEHCFTHAVYIPSRHCVVCDQSLGFGELNHHIRSCHRAYRYKCEDCSLIFRGVKEFAQHKLSRARGDKYMCGICGFGFNLSPVLEYHILTSHVKGCRGVLNECEELKKFAVKMEPGTMPYKLTLPCNEYSLTD